MVIKNYLFPLKNFILSFTVLLTLSLILKPLNALALNESTRNDLSVLHDALTFEVKTHPTILNEWLPALVAIPQAYWQRSQSDFQSSVLQTLNDSFPQNSRDLLLCTECVQNRTFVHHDGRLVVQNGELSALDLHQLRQQPLYQKAKALFLIKETSSGVEMKILSLSRGEILFSKIADHQQDLSKAVSPLRLAQEFERRQRGESLNYIFLNAGIYPHFLFNIEFLEQWGHRNQHLSGFALSFVEPAAAIGGTYHYLWPSQRQFNLSASAFVKLSFLSRSSSSAPSQNPWELIYQGAAHYALSGSYGLFASVNSQGTFSVGVSFLNPVLFPFLL